MNGSRQAALTLHALPAAERNWVLERLEPQERQLMQSHLDELAALGIPADQRLVDEALNKARAAAAPRAVIAGASAMTMQTLLSAEPAGLVARVLALGDWPWARELMAGLAAQRREEVQSSREQAQVPRPQLDEWLLDELERRVQAVLPEEIPLQEAPAAKPGWIRLGRGREAA